MFDVTSDDIATLNDSDLRELVGRLCEAELASRGLSPSHVTWGGSQTAPDGGLDVRVALPAGAAIDGFVPRIATGFQVKKPDMPRASILAEMRYQGSIRDVIQRLADESGAYVIISSQGSTADLALGTRRNAMREALTGVPNADHLHTDFYDRSRMATWVRRHPGLIAWVKEKIGRSFSGWRSYGAWSGAAEGVGAEYLLDDKLRIQFERHRDDPAKPVGAAIDELRDELATPGKVVRLVGLSGVGKTRLVQALFDNRIGNRALVPALAIYTNMSDDPDPQPTGLASDLIANRMRAVLVVDNCPPDLHRRLSDVCAASGSTLSVITVEYDVRDDQPEGTQVVTLDTASPELIAQLVLRRFSHLSQVDARTIADASGGNARIAIALAETVGIHETISGLTDDELFRRLFEQRHFPNDELLRAAEVCSLVYSFHGEALIGEDAELSRLASLAEQSPLQLSRHVGELCRRDLVQRRSVWRAVLPHAMANRLAARALEDLPYDIIEEYLVAGSAPRLGISFSRRLSFLHEHPRAVAIVSRWLAPGGRLGEVAIFGEPERTMFGNVAPVLPSEALAALERANEIPSGATDLLVPYRLLLRSIAYDADLFERSANLLARIAATSTDQGAAKESADVFSSLFTIYLSGTHASVEQRLAIVERQLCSNNVRNVSLGLAAIDSVLDADHFSSHYHFNFGGRPRDYGYRPKTVQDVSHWYGSALALIERLAFTNEIHINELRDLLARKFRSLWTSAGTLDAIERLCRMFASLGFWREGWAACRQTIRFDSKGMPPEIVARLSALELELRPGNLADQVRGMVLNDRAGGLDLGDVDIDGDISAQLQRLDELARELGEAVAADQVAFFELSHDIFSGGARAWAFGRGLAIGAKSPREMWASFAASLAETSRKECDVQVLRGFLFELWSRDKELAHELLDVAANDSSLSPFIVAIHSAVRLDERGVARLLDALRNGRAPVWTYQYLGHGKTVDSLSGAVLHELLEAIAEEPDGYEVAIDVYAMRLHSDSSEKREHDASVIDVGRFLLERVRFKKNSDHADYRLARIAEACLQGDDGRPLTITVINRLKAAISAHETHPFANDDLTQSLLHLHPHAALDALLEADEDGFRPGLHLLEQAHDHRPHPTDVVSVTDLIAWCDADKEVRYPLAASFVCFAVRAKDNDAPLAWSEQAKALLKHAPNPGQVLRSFVARFRPMSWSGSRASLMEANSRLLDLLDMDSLTAQLSYVAEVKAMLSREIAQERLSEAERDKDRNERFE